MSRHFPTEVLTSSRALISTVFLTVFILLTPLSANSADLTSVFVNGVRVEAYPTMRNGVAYLPIQVMAQAMGSEITWDASLGRVKVDGKVSSASVLNNNGMLLLPIESFITGIGGSVVFDGRRNMIRVETPEYMASGPSQVASASKRASTTETSTQSPSAQPTQTAQATTANPQMQTSSAPANPAAAITSGLTTAAAVGTAVVVANSGQTTTATAAPSVNNNVEPTSLTAGSVSRAGSVNSATKQTGGAAYATSPAATASGTGYATRPAATASGTGYATRPTATASGTGYATSQTATASGTGYATRPATPANNASYGLYNASASAPTVRPASSSGFLPTGPAATNQAVNRAPGAGGSVGRSSVFIPRTVQNSVFKVTVSNMETVPVIKDYYKPKAGYKFVVVSLSQQNISNQVQIYTGKFSLVDNNQISYDNMEGLSNFWLVILRPFGVNFGYLVYEIPQNANPSNLMLRALNQAPLTINL